jgi:hypothetical protein
MAGNGHAAAFRRLSKGRLLSKFNQWQTFQILGDILSAPGMAEILLSSACPL